MSGKSLSLSGIDKISEFLHTAGRAGMVVSLTEEQTAHVRDAIAVLADIDPYFVDAANFKPAELLVTFQRISSASNHLKSLENQMKDYSEENVYRTVYVGYLAEIEKRACEHATARDALNRLAAGIVDRARIERSPKL